MHAGIAPNDNLLPIYKPISISGTTLKNTAPYSQPPFSSKMSRQSRDSLNHSSIALLQERFKQLQRAKEMREEKELMRQSQRVNSTTCQDPSKLFFHSELVLPPRQPLQGSSSVQHNFQNHHAHPQATEAPSFANLQYTDRVMYRSSNFEDSDIDTSLHL